MSEVLRSRASTAEQLITLETPDPVYPRIGEIALIGLILPSELPRMLAPEALAVGLNPQAEVARKLAEAEETKLALAS